jgi:hypothetical protein
MPKKTNPRNTSKKGYLGPLFSGKVFTVVCSQDTRIKDWDFTYTVWGSDPGQDRSRDHRGPLSLTNSRKEIERRIKACKKKLCCRYCDAQIYSSIIRRTKPSSWQKFYWTLKAVGFIKKRDLQRKLHWSLEACQQFLDDAEKQKLVRIKRRSDNSIWIVYTAKGWPPKPVSES